jgi:hypothetical protein
MKKVLLIGGKNSKSFEKHSKSLNIEINHHPAHIKQKNTKRYFEPLIKQADIIVLFANSCSHQNMWDVRSLSKEYNKPILFPKGTGMSRTLNMVLDKLSNEQVG